MYQKLKQVLLLSSIALLSACGGGGGSGVATRPATPTTFAQTYTASATAGELLRYSIDTAALTYSYVITKSSYGCEVSTAACHSGSGLLVKNSDGTYSPSTSLSSKVFALQNGLLVGSVVLNLNGADRRVPILGVANPATTTADLAGTYNFMSLQCAGKTYGVFTGCGTFQGTVTVASAGTYTTCEGGNITAVPQSCSSSVSGTITSLGGGIFALRATAPAAGSTTNYMVAFRAPNGQKVGFVDFNDSLVYGYGQAVISTLESSSSADVVGNYAWSNDYGDSGLVTINPNSTTSGGLAITPNSPWNGISTVTGGGSGTGYGMLAGNGVYVYRNPTIVGAPAYFEVGLRVN
jgi:hypothetical protein